MELYWLWPLIAACVALASAGLLALELSRKSRGGGSMLEIAAAVRIGARAYQGRQAQYTFITALILLALMMMAGHFQRAWELDWRVGAGFLAGVAGAQLASFIGMGAATRANLRTAAAAADEGLRGALCVAISGGGISGLAVVGLTLLLLVSLFSLFNHHGPSLVAFALGTSLVALFARVGGGIYTKGADIGADLVRKLDDELPENDPRNAASIADHVGDNVGGIAGLGADLMESLTAAVVAATLIALSLRQYGNGDELGMWLLPLLVIAPGALGTLAGVLVVRLLSRGEPKRALLAGLFVAGLIAIVGAWFLVEQYGLRFREPGNPTPTPYQPRGLFFATLAGALAGGLGHYFTDYYTSPRFKPVRRVAENAATGAGLAILEGLSVGMRSCAAPTITLALVVLVAHGQAGHFGIALAATGYLATAGMILAVNAFGPIADNAAGIAEMAWLERPVRNTTASLDAVGNSTGAIGKGFAVTGALLAALALWLAFLAHIWRGGLPELDDPHLLAGLLLGGMFPFLVSSMLFRAVNRSAHSILGEVRRQLAETPGLREGKARPDYARCIDLATRSALNGMLLPSLLALAAPVAVGLLLGRTMLAGFLLGALLCGLMLGIQTTNSGGALDNAKKHIEEGNYGGPDSPAHQAALVGDTVGDPLKDTVGPAVNILIKLMCVVALLIAPMLG